MVDRSDKAALGVALSPPTYPSKSEDVLKLIKDGGDRGGNDFGHEYISAALQCQQSPCHAGWGVPVASRHLFSLVTASRPVVLLSTSQSSSPRSSGSHSVPPGGFAPSPGVI